MTGRRLGLATLIVTLLAAGSAWAAFEPEGSPYPTGSEPYAVYSADFNADGRADVVVLNGSSSTINVYLRQAAGGFAEEAGSPVPVTFGPSFAVVGNFNGDALPDLAVAGYSGNGVSILLRQAGGGFAVQTFGTGFYASAIGAGDFNGDGVTDLAVANWFGNQVTIYQGNGSGGFAQGAAYATGTNPRQIEVADFNGDQLQDLAITNAGSNTVTVLLRSAAGGFVPEGAPVTVGTAPQDLAAADFNGDGRVDLAVANVNSNSVSVLLRNATNNGFTDEGGSPIAVGTGPNGIVAADFDRDGRADLAVAGTPVTVLRRNAGGGFTTDASLTVAGSAYGIAAGDFDGDSRPDLAVSSLGTNTLSILRNPAPAQPPVVTPTPTPTATTTPVPAPVAGKSVNATPVDGKVKVKLPGAKKFIDLPEAASLPVGTTVDTRDGRVTLLAAGTGGKADFYDGLFKISQTKGKAPVTTLTLTEVLSCPKAKKSAIASAAKKKTRKLWGSGKGKFRTEGKYAAATVRGTRWLVQDYCDRTTTKVREGVVSVRDKVKHRSVTLRKGKTYTARKKR